MWKGIYKCNGGQKAEEGWNAFPLLFAAWETEALQRGQLPLSCPVSL
jgi:hypothetical protein